MTQDDYDALKEFLRGFAGGSIVFIVFCLLCALTIWISGSNTETDKSQSTKVVGEYKGCDIVRYTPDYSARYAYFLDCK